MTSFVRVVFCSDDFVLFICFLMMDLFLGRLGTIANSPDGQINSMKLKPSNNLRWRRVVFKISGAALAGSAPNNIDPKVYFLLNLQPSLFNLSLDESMHLQFYHESDKEWFELW